jgi:hypothetical protein
METSSIIYPDYIRIVERKVGGWAIKHGDWFYKRIPIANVDMNDLQLMYGISHHRLSIDLFRVNGGKAGYYIADLRNKAYYYCGEHWRDVKEQLIKMGIGRHDPIS